jgi:hypothetical protein
MHKCDGDCFCDPDSVVEAAITLAAAIATITAHIRELLS